MSFHANRASVFQRIPKCKFYSMFLLFTVLQNSKYFSANPSSSSRNFLSRVKKELFFSTS